MGEAVHTMTRYARQMQLPDIGQAGQAKLSTAHVAVIGAGGLGSPVLQYLAGAGVGKLSIYDPDIVEESNLHRQPLFRMTDLGRAKANVARDALHALNPHVDVTAHVAALGPSTAPAVAADADMVVDAADSFAVSYILSDACYAAKTPLISASVLGQTGYVGAFCQTAPSLRAVFPELPSSGATCASAGVLGPVVGVIGTLQAQIALRALLNLTPTVMGQMVTADLAAMRFGGFRFLDSPEPDAALPFIAAHTIREDDMTIELRDPTEAPQPITPNAIRMSHTALEDIGPLTGQRIVLCCHSGLRAWQAANRLRGTGKRNLALLAVRACT